MSIIILHFQRPLFDHASPAYSSKNKKDDDANDEANTEIKYAPDFSPNTSIEKEGSINEYDVKFNN